MESPLRIWSYGFMFPKIPWLSVSRHKAARLPLMAVFAAALVLLSVSCGAEPTPAPPQPLDTPAPTTTRPATAATPTVAMPTDAPTPPPNTPAATPPPSSGPLVSLPEDEAPHETPIEWWYFNGFLWDAAGNEYSYHFVTFQSPTLPLGTPHLLHATLSDHVGGTHSSGERGTLATLDPTAPGVDIDADGWVMRGDGKSYELRFGLDGTTVDLEAISLREAVLHDSVGLVDLGDAGSTYYYSRTRLELDGWIDDDTGRREVSGAGWMDHQWGDISRGDVGWDWINLQMDDGSDLMVAVLWKPAERQPVPNDEPWPLERERIAAYATFVDSDGTVTHVPGKNVSLEALYAWLSPETSIVYPSTWRLLIEPLKIDTTLFPVMEHAEFAGSEILPVAYWEGAVTGKVRRDRTFSDARGFVELVGYDPVQAEVTPPVPAPRR